MKVRNHRLYDDGAAVPMRPTPNKSGQLAGGRPKYLVIHYTAAGSASGSIAHMANPAAKASAQLVIGRDGAVTQMGRLDEKLWHAGRSSWNGLIGLNSHSVGIELANWGKLSGGPGNWKTWVGGPVLDDNAIAAAHKHEPGVTRGWEVYAEAQVAACINAARAICEAYGLGPAEIIGHDDISPGRKSDPGPAWDMTRFRAAVFGRSSDEAAEGPDQEPRWTVAASTLNMRAGAGIGTEVIGKLSRGEQVVPIEQPGTWWLVARLVDGEEDAAGWVHSHYLQPA